MALASGTLFRAAADQRVENQASIEAPAAAVRRPTNLFEAFRAVGSDAPGRAAGDK
jgi:hypothetical protein